MRNPVPVLRATTASNTPTPNSVFHNFNTSIENSTHAIYGLVQRVHVLADQARGPSPSSADAAGGGGPPSTEGMLVSLERAVASLQEAVSRLDNN
jgi:hypothetical protein